MSNKSQSERFARLDRICEEQVKVLQIMYEDGGDEAVTDYITGTLAATIDIVMDNNNERLAARLATNTETFTKQMLIAAFTLRLKP